MAFLLIPLAIRAAIVKHKNDEAERRVREREQAERANLERERAELERQERQRIAEYNARVQAHEALLASQRARELDKEEQRRREFKVQRRPKQLEEEAKKMELKLLLQATASAYSANLLMIEFIFSSILPLFSM